MATSPKALSATIAACLAFAMAVPVGGFLGLVGDATAQEDESVLRIGLTLPIDSLNPNLGLTDTSQIFYSLVYDSLQGIGEDLSTVPCLAKEWRIVPTDDPELVLSGEPYGSVWEYDLADYPAWSDGVNFTADDVVWNINLNAENMNTLWAYQPYSYHMDYAEAVDSDTVRIHYYNRSSGEPLPISFGDQILVPMLPRHKLEAMSAVEIGFTWNGAFDGEDPPVVGTGPFIPTATLVADWIAGNNITLVKNENYFGAYNYGRVVNFDKLEFHFFDEDAALRLALEYGEIDVGEFGRQSYEALKSDVFSGSLDNVMPGGSSRPDGYFTNVLVNMNNAGPNPSRLDQTIRHAMAIATNKNYIVSNMYFDEAAQGSTLVAEADTMWHYWMMPNETLNYDKVVANGVLESAGYIDADFDGIRECTASSKAVQEGWVTEGTELAYEMFTRREHPEERDIAVYLQSEWADIGIAVNYIVMDEAEMSTHVYAYAYDTAIWYWCSPPDPNYILWTQSQGAWNSWSDTRYYNASYEDNYRHSVTELNQTERRTYVDNCQRIHYLDSAYIILAYLNQTYAWRTDTFTGWGDWAAYPGRGIGAYWSGNPLYFELIPIDSTNLPPEGVQLDSSPANPQVGESVQFTARASDPDGDAINFTISFGDGYVAKYPSAGGPGAWQVAYFDHVYPMSGTFTATVWADDGTGAPGHNVSDSVVVSVHAPTARSVDYRWYDIFNVPLGEWWYRRWEVTRVDQPLSDVYPYVYASYGAPPGDDNIFTSMRLDVTGVGLPEVNMLVTPEFLPLLGSERGGNASINWWMQYLTSDEISWYPNSSAWNDGWVVSLNGTVNLDYEAAQAVLGLNESGWMNFTDWWSVNEVSVTENYTSWLMSEGNDRLDIFPMYEYALTFLHFDLDAERVGDAVILHYDTVSWGMEALMARWLHEAFIPAEWFYEGMDFHANIGPATTDLDMSTAVAYASRAWETSLVPDGGYLGEPCWVWEARLGDYLQSDPGHPYSDYDPYAYKTTLEKSPLSAFHGSYVPYSGTPAAWNLSEGETLSFTWPTGDQLFKEFVSPGVVANVTGPMTVKYSEPMEMDLPSVVVNNQSNRTLTFSGPADMWTWSKEQVRHEYLAEEWDRVGLLPWGMPYIEFQLDRGLNTPPTAIFTYEPEFGDVFTTYLFDASLSWDLDTAFEGLAVRWDWENDGTWDTGWMSNKSATHQFASAGNYTVALEVIDSDNATDVYTVEIVVVELIPEFGGPAFVCVMVAVIALVWGARRRRPQR